ncbi:hypothetical protein ElyMa_000583400, partial [Elysia marginata]
LSECISELQLTDIWRLHHTAEKDFTWSRGSPTIARRLDYVILGENLARHADET